MQGARAAAPPTTDEPAAIIDLRALSENLAAVRTLVQPGVRVMAAVKANAYGHGLTEVSAHLESLGVNWFAVATPTEALALRESGTAGRVLVLSPVRDPGTVARLAEAGVDITVTDAAAVQALTGVNAPTKLRVHLAIDTGMGRLGRPAGEAVEVATSVARSPQLELAGLFTHFATAGEQNTAFAEQQLRAFRGAVAELTRAGVEVPLKHAANSAAILGNPGAQFDMVRAGIALYGYHPSPFTERLALPLKPVMRLEAPVTFVKRVRAGTPISYGAAWRAATETTIATVRLGYADGYPRALTVGGWANLAGRAYKVAGAVCMDQLMLDVGNADVTPGDRAIFWGEGGPAATRLAAATGTIVYELLAGVSGRVPRHYVR